MAFLSSLDISGSGLTASRLRMDVIAENLSNAETTRTSEGGPYRRKMVVYECADTAQTFRNMLEAQVNGNGDAAVPQGVKVTGIVEDQTPFNVEYDPTNPDANAQGYVEKPNVDLIQETTDMMAASRAYNANLTAFDAVKNMATKALELGK
ncbi:MAG: Flagellar basal-body rod protein FlgC [Thermocaproicibacter melissae]|jgi:flagellar basal-body rod protein FlgC|uniref:flagellar basal body rod protein FlgC n=1 Tax=Thermocaproicibacter melissae TaxID=2966552 RepID=UPI003A1027EA